MFIRIIKFKKDVDRTTLAKYDINEYIERVDILNDNHLKSAGFDNGIFTISLKGNSPIINDVELFNDCDFIQGVVSDQEVKIYFKNNNIIPIFDIENNRIVLNIKGTEIIKNMIVYDRK